MEMILKRCRHSGKAIDGKLIIDDTRFCDTAENSDTALPQGRYRIMRNFCKQYGRYMPLILPADVESAPCGNCPKLRNVCNNTTMPIVCPMLKSGNGIWGRADGSIILGTYIAPGCLSHPNEPFDLLSERLRKLTTRGSGMTLKIEEI